LFSSGLVSGKISEARADRRAADAALAQARENVEEQVIDAWQARQTAELTVQAAADQAKAAEAALDNVRNEVRVGEKPTLDLLNARQEALTAEIAQLRAEGARIVTAYRLNALIGREPSR
jgi:outer membrane protein